ncbi:4Fe-4S binding protein [bacterium]|nr:4Fe-4S binding protein [bacterium]
MRELLERRAPLRRPLHRCRFGSAVRAGARFRSKPRFDAEACVGCGACAEMCRRRASPTDDPHHSPPVRRLSLRLGAASSAATANSTASRKRAFISPRSTTWRSSIATRRSRRWKRSCSCAKSAGRW